MAFWINVWRLLCTKVVASVAACTTLILGLGAFLAIPTIYTSQATLILTTSPTNQAALAGDPGAAPQINPLLNFSEGLTTAIAILVQVMNTDAVMADLTDNDRKTSVKITDIGDASYLGSKGPFLFITGTSTRSGGTAQDIVARSAQRSRDELLARQKALNAPQSQFITTLFVVPPTDAVASSASRIEGGVAGALLGLVGTVGVAYMLVARRSPGRFAKGSSVDSLLLEPAMLEPSTPGPPQAAMLPAKHSSMSRGECTSPTNGHPVTSDAEAVRPSAPLPPVVFPNGRMSRAVKAFAEAPTYKLQATSRESRSVGNASMPPSGATSASTPLTPGADSNAKASDMQSPTVHLSAVPVANTRSPTSDSTGASDSSNGPTSATPEAQTEAAPSRQAVEGAGAGQAEAITEVDSMEVSAAEPPVVMPEETAEKSEGSPMTTQPPRDSEDGVPVPMGDQPGGSGMSRRPRPKPRPRSTSIAPPHR